MLPAPIRVSPRVARSIVRVGADLDVLLDHHPADLRHLVVDAAVGGVAEAVGAQHRAGVDDAPGSDLGVVVEHGVRMEHRALPHHAAAADGDEGVDGRARRRSGCRRRSRRTGRRGRSGRPRSRAPGWPWGGRPPGGALRDGGRRAAAPARTDGSSAISRSRPRAAPASDGPTSRAPAELATRLTAIAGVFQEREVAGARGFQGADRLDGALRVPFDPAADQHRRDRRAGSPRRYLPCGGGGVQALDHDAA